MKKLVLLTFLVFTQAFSMNVESEYNATLKLERPKIEASYNGHISEYYRQARTLRNRRNTASTSLSSNLKIKKIKKVQQNASLIYFKQGDMDKDCKSHVSRIKNMGFSGIVLFYPVHFSGGNSSNYKMPENPIYGKHYRYEVANAISQGELNRCLDTIAKYGLKLNFAPHLESIKTLVSPSEGEWRLQSGIPINRHYYEHSFGPLVNYMKNTKNFKKNGELSVTAFSEIDPMVLSYPKESLAIVNKLKKGLSKNIEVIYNTNGDFFNGWDMPQAKKVVSCHYLEKFISSVDTLAPSIYGDRGHVSKNESGIVTSKATINQYINRMDKKLNELCGNSKYHMSVKSKSIAFGEFALDPSKPSQSYEKFFQDKSVNPKFVNYWNHSEWDHHGISNDEQNARFKNELFEIN